MFESEAILSAMPYFQDEIIEFHGSNYCVRKKMIQDQEFRFIDSHFIYNYFDASKLYCFTEHCEIHKIDAVFLRLPPFCNFDFVPPDRFKKYNFTKNNTCLIDTKKDYFLDMSRSYRQQIRKAKREYFVESFEPNSADLLIFAQNYNKYMKQKSTSASYYLKPETFQKIGGCSDILIVNVRGESQNVLVSALFVKYRNVYYYWFSYSNGKLPQGVGQLSIFAACERAVKEQSIGVFLGGGMTDEADDLLWKFKKYFSSQHLKIEFIGLSISNKLHDLGTAPNGRFFPW